MAKQMKTTPRHLIWKANDIYECRACGKMYTSLMTETHIKMCTKIEEYKRVSNDKS